MDPFHDIYRKENLPPSLRANNRSAHETQGAGSGSAGATASGATSQNNDFYRSRHRRRRRRSSSNGSNSGPWVWFALFALVLLYAVVLFAFLSKKYVKQRQPVAQPAAPAIATSQPPAVASTPTLNIANRIAAWKQIPDAILEAQAFQERGDLARAEQRIEAALEQCPDSLRLKTLLAQLSFQQNHYDRAAELLTSLLEINPDDFNARTLLGMVLVAQTNWTEALTVAKWILDSNPNSAAAHDIAASAYLATDRKALAIPHLKRLVLLEKDNIVAQNKLGRAYADLGEYVKAIQVFNEVLSRNDNDATTYFNLAACYARQGLAEEAATVLSRAAPRFGEKFVASWIQNPEFAAISSNRLITALVENWTSPPSENNP